MKEEEPTVAATQLLPLVVGCLSKIKVISQLDKLISNERITLSIIQKSPVLCLSDFVHSIQAFKHKNSQDALQAAHPRSKKITNFYSVIERSWIALNSKLQDIGEPSEYPHPYEPYFHFKHNYDEYKDQRPTLSYKVECETVEVRRWSLKIVNISGSGYYGVVLELLDFKFIGKKMVKDVAQKQIREKLESLRLQDLRLFHSETENQKTPCSLFYYCRNVNLNPISKKKINNIIAVDKAQKLLRFNDERKTSLINFGEMEGVNCLQHPINRKDVNQQKIKRVSLRELEVFFSVAENKEQKDNKAKEYKPGELWSSDDQLSQEEPSKDAIFQKSSEEESSSESDGEDLLRNLYLKQFNNMKIV